MQTRYEGVAVVVVVVVHAPAVEDLGAALALQKDAVLPVAVDAAAQEPGPAALHRDAPQVAVQPAADEGRLPAVVRGAAVVPAGEASAGAYVVREKV